MAAPRPEPAPLKKIGDLRMVWRNMLRYPGRLVAAGLSLLTAAGATLAIPDGLRRVIGERVIADIRAAVHDNMLRLAPRFFEENRPSEIASRITADTAVIETVVGSSVSIALRNLVMGIGATIYLFTLAPMLTLGLLIG